MNIHTLVGMFTSYFMLCHKENGVCYFTIILRVKLLAVVFTWNK